MRVAIHQPNYAPWCGYFAKMQHSDVFVFLDDVQMPGGQSYVYRCSVREGDRARWLSIPNKHRLGDQILDVEFADSKWARKHLGSLQALYGRSPHFKDVYRLLEPLYKEPGSFLADFNMRLIGAIAEFLNLACRIERSSLLKPEGRGDDRLISLARITGADTYLSGAGGQNYQDPTKFAAAGIGLDVRAYEPVRYDQGADRFVPGLSILDALFYLGRDALGLLEYGDCSY